MIPISSIVEMKSKLKEEDFSMIDREKLLKEVLIELLLILYHQNL